MRIRDIDTTIYGVSPDGLRNYPETAGLILPQGYRLAQRGELGSPDNQYLDPMALTWIRERVNARERYGDDGLCAFLRAVPGVTPVIAGVTHEDFGG